MYCLNCHFLPAPCVPISWCQMVTSPFVFTSDFAKELYRSSGILLNFKGKSRYSSIFSCVPLLFDESHLLIGNTNEIISFLKTNYSVEKISMKGVSICSSEMRCLQLSFCLFQRIFALEKPSAPETKYKTRAEQYIFTIPRSEKQLQLYSQNSQSESNPAKYTIRNELLKSPPACAIFICRQATILQQSDYVGSEFGRNVVSGTAVHSRCKLEMVRLELSWIARCR